MTATHVRAMVLAAFAVPLIGGAVAGQAAPVAPVPADPAIEDAGEAFRPADVFHPGALLAGLYERSTVSTGSTAGFPTDPRVPPGFSVSDPSLPARPGATGWWTLIGMSGSVYTIDTCGSDFAAGMTVYEVDNEKPFAKVKGSTTDGCTDPIEARYFSEHRNGVTPVLLARIDDATGAGGEYTVHYTRTIPEVVARIRKARVGKNIKRGRAKVAMRVFFRAEGPGARVKCAMDGGDPVNCLERPTFERVASGRHRVDMTVTDRFGTSATDSIRFRVARK